MKKFLIIFSLLISFGISSVYAVPIVKSGKYTRLGDTSTGWQFKCGFQFWKECYLYDAAVPLVGFDGDHNNVCYPCHILPITTINESDGTTSEVFEVVVN